jgi:hypothetical protein
MPTIQERQSAKARHEAGHAAVALYFGMLVPNGVTILDGEEEAGAVWVEWNLSHLESTEQIVRRGTVVMAGRAAEPLGFRREQDFGKANWITSCGIYGDLRDDIEKARCLKWITRETDRIWLNHIKPYLDGTDRATLDSVVKHLRALPEYEGTACYEVVGDWFQAAKAILAMPRSRCFVDRATDWLLQQGLLTSQKCYEVWDDCKAASYPVSNEGQA